MILGVGHIALTCRNLPAGLGVLERSGFPARFVEEDLPNPAGKRALLAAYGPVHAVAYCRGERGVALELTSHGPGLPSGESPYRVIFSSRLLESEEAAAAGALEEAVSEAISQGVGAAVWRPFGAPYLHLGAPSSGAAVRALALEVSDLGRSEAFWTLGLGARLVRSSHTDARRPWRLLRLPSPLAHLTLDVVLVEDSGAPAGCLLDSGGFTCMALVTNRIEEDLTKALERGGSGAAPPMSIVVDGKALSIAFLRGPGGELIELVQPAAASREAAA